MWKLPLRDRSCWKPINNNAVKTSEMKRLKKNKNEKKKKEGKKEREGDLPPSLISLLSLVRKREKPRESEEERERELFYFMFWVELRTSIPIEGA